MQYRPWSTHEACVFEFVRCRQMASNPKLTADVIRGSLNPMNGAHMKQGGQSSEGANRRRAEKAHGRKVLGEANLGKTELHCGCRWRGDKPQGRHRGGL